MNKPATKLEISVLFLLLLAYLFWFALPTSIAGSDNYRMADTFNTDEADMLRLLKPEIKNREFNMRFYGYGHLYYNNGLVPLIIKDVFSPVSEQQIIIVYRALSALYFIGTIIIVFFLAKKFFGGITAWLSVMLLLTGSTKLYFYSTMLHPDTAQIFFIALTLFFCCKYVESIKWKYLVFAAFFAGFAFGTKYAGMMLLPLILILGCLIPHLSSCFCLPDASHFAKEKDTRITLLDRSFNRAKWYLAFFFCMAGTIIFSDTLIVNYVALTENSQNFFLLVKICRFVSFFLSLVFLCFIIFNTVSQKKYLTIILEKIADAVLLSAVFLCAFAICSPGCVRGLNFVDGFIYNTGVVQYGHWFRNSLGVSGWLKILLSENVLSYTVFILFATGFFYHAFALKKKPVNKQFFYYLILFFWILIYFSTLVMRVNAGFEHYLLPVVPFIIILGSNMLEKIVFFIQQKFLQSFSIVLLIVVPLLILGAEFFQSSKKLVQFRNNLANKVETSDAVKAGVFVQNNFPSETRILYDRYSYIPSEFGYCYTNWGITQQQIMETMPHLIIIHSEIYQNFLNIDSAVQFLHEGKDNYLARHYAYTNLLSGNSDYKLLKDFGQVKIFSIAKNLKKNIIFQIENNYETQNEKWTYNNVVYDSLHYVSGKKSEKLQNEYSAGFSASIGDVISDSAKRQHLLYVSATAYSLLTDGASAMLVIDFIRNGAQKTSNWEVKNFEDAEPDKNNWRKINFCRQIPIDALPTDEVKIYIWNNSAKPVYIDDFSIEVHFMEGLGKHNNQ